VRWLLARQILFPPAIVPRAGRDDDGLATWDLLGDPDLEARELSKR
jgi:hypothetical protein